MIQQFREHSGSTRDRQVSKPFPPAWTTSSACAFHVKQEQLWCVVVRVRWACKEWGDGIHLWAADHACISQCLPHAARFTSKEASQLHASSDTAQPAFSSVLTFPHFLVMLDISHWLVRRQPPANAISLHRSLFHTIAVLLFLSVPSEMSIVTNRESTQLRARHTTSCSRCDGVPDVASKDSF